MKILFTTGSYARREFITAPPARNYRTFITSKVSRREFITYPVVKNYRTFISASKSYRQFITENVGGFAAICCKQPTWLMEYRRQAISYFYKNILNVLNKSLLKESYGKEYYDGYRLSLKFKSLIDYLSQISLHMRKDEYAAYIRTPQYYRDLYSLDKVQEYFRCRRLNINPLLVIFKIDTYTSSNYNYDYMSWAYNVEITDSSITVVNKIFKDYFTNYILTPIEGEDISPITGSQTTFTTSNTIKQILSFLINGNDRSEKVTFTGNTITYNPTGGTFPYTIQATDTVIVNYIYEL